MRKNKDFNSNHNRNQVSEIARIKSRYNKDCIVRTFAEVVLI